MTGLLLALMVLQSQAPEATATVDRTRLHVGEELLLTVRARSRVTAQPVRIVVPPLQGFALVGSRELTEVTLSGDGPPIRTTVRELRLRAESPGRRVIGSVRLEQGTTARLLAPITVDVDSVRAGGSTPLSPVARALLDSAPVPDSADAVSVSLVTPEESVLVGEQVDLVAVAWFPRDLRLRLRRPPVLTLRTPDGVWAYPQSAPLGGDVAGSRLVQGQWMDLFVAHQVVFPLQATPIRVAPAFVEFSLPVTYSFFSREDHYSLHSEAAVIAVEPLPQRDRPEAHRGVVAEDLTIDVDVSATQTRVGEPIEVIVTSTGTGNVALWPEPELHWPAGFRAYPAQTVVQLEPRDGRTAGSKTFRYLVVPDSAGVFVLTDAMDGYPYYDPGPGEYRVAHFAPQTVSVALGAEPRPARALPRLIDVRRPSWADQVGARLTPWGWVVLFILPPVLALLVRRRSGPSASRSRITKSRDREPLAELEHEFQALLANHVPDPAVRTGSGLAQALRAAGMEGAVADHVVRLRDRLHAARFGPGRGSGRAAAADAHELGAELQKVLRFLDGDRRRGGRGGRGGGGGGARRNRPAAAFGILLLAGAQPLAAQLPSADALYAAGALRAAADSFAARVDREPSVAAHWYNLGATLYRAGADGKAIAAWTRAARLAPRDPVIRRARRLLPPPDAASDPLLAVGRATPAEWGLAAGLAWVVCWLLVLRRQRLWGVVFGALVLAATVPALFEFRRRHRPVAVVLQPGTVVREAPYGSASPRVTLEGGAAVLVGKTYGAWVEVRRHDGIHGWLLRGDVSRL